MPSDYQDWQTPQAHADAIAVTGVPLLANPVQAYMVQGQNLPAGSNNNVLLDTAAQPVTDLSAALSYEVRGVIQSNAASLVPFCRLRFEWWADQAMQFLLYRDEWIIPCGDTNQGPTTYGSGPVRGGFLRVLVDNWDTVNAMTVNDFELYLSSRPCQFKQPDLRSANVNAHNPAYSVPGDGDNFDGLVGAIRNGALAAGQTVSWLFGLYNGAIDIQASVTGTTPNVSMTPQYWSKHSNQLLPLGNVVTLTGAALSQSARVVTPRWPLILTFAELSGANPANVFVTAVAEVVQ